uniref:serine hydrolase domain-containing protein n=1 Tax=Catenulispora rubra TaxID=280293 RepID=UPI001E65B815
NSELVVGSGGSAAAASSRSAVAEHGQIGDHGARARRDLGEAGDTFRDNSSDLQIANPSGGAISTTADLARFARALLTHQLLDPAMTATLTTGKVTVHRPGGPAQDSYAYGFEDARVSGVRVIGHNGGTPGYEGQLDIYPDTGTTVAIMCNQDRSLVPAIQRTEAMLTGSGGAPTG